MAIELGYLASPYSSPDPQVRQWRYSQALEAAGNLIARGEYIFSPIAHAHPIAMERELDLGWEYWSKFDLYILSKCHKLFVLMIEGWDQSVGVTAERKEAVRLGLPIFSVNSRGEIIR